MKHYSYDLEVYKNIFTATFVNMGKANNENVNTYLEAKARKDKLAMQIALANLDHEVFVIYHNPDNPDDTINDVFDLKDFMTQSLILYGYNSKGYDDTLLSLALHSAALDPVDFNTLIYESSCAIIELDRIPWDNPLSKFTRNHPWTSVDVQSLFHLGYKGLKMVAIAMKYPFIQDLPIEPQSYVPKDKIDGLLHYNLNDCLMVQWMIKLKKDELQSRIDAINMYKLDNSVLSSSRPQLAKSIISVHIEKLNGGDKKYKEQRSYRRMINFDDIILDFDFKIPEFKKFYEHLRTIKIHVGQDKFSEKFTYAGVTYQFGMGGLHTVDTPNIFKSDDNYWYRDVDADSYYPWLIINHGFEPKHLKGLFLPIFRLIVNTRMTAKKAGKAKLDKEDKEKLEALIDSKIKNQKLANILKIVINASFGQFNDAYSFLFDPKALFATTVNGQVGLLYVAEKIILAGSEIVSVNTDGLISKIPRKFNAEYEKASIQAFADFKATCEFTDYDLYVRTTVNDYLTIKTDGKYKLKGDFEFNKLVLHDGFSKGFSMPIVALALVKYYTEGIPVKTTIYEHKDIYDFCLSSNIGRQFVLIEHKVVNGEIITDEVQRHVRYFISNKGCSLTKYDRVKKKHTRLSAGYTMTIFNDYLNKPMKDYDINYSFYMKEVYKLIDKIEKRNTKILRKTSGTLFD